MLKECKSWSFYLFVFFRRMPGFGALNDERGVSGRKDSLRFVIMPGVGCAVRTAKTRNSEMG